MNNMFHLKHSLEFKTFMMKLNKAIEVAPGKIFFCTNCWKVVGGKNLMKEHKNHISIRLHAPIQDDDYFEFCISQSHCSKRKRRVQIMEIEETMREKLSLD